MNDLWICIYKGWSFEKQIDRYGSTVFLVSGSVLSEQVKRIFERISPWQYGNEKWNHFSVGVFTRPANDLCGNLVDDQNDEENKWWLFLLRPTNERLHIHLFHDRGIKITWYISKRNRKPIILNTIRTNTIKVNYNLSQSDNLFIAFISIWSFWSHDDQITHKALWIQTEVARL